MGIDAEMFVKVKGKVTEAQLIAAEHTLFERFGAQAMHTWAASLLEEVDEWQQDGETLHPKAGETFVKIHLWTRYYGEGYERGDVRLILDVAEVLEHIFPRGAVYYGGDSSGVCAEPFDAAARAKLRAHWIANGREPYSRGKNPFMGKADTDDGPPCRRCKVRTHRYGWGATYAAYFCECGERVEVRNGVTKVSSLAERKKRRSELEQKARKLLPEAEQRELADMGWDD